MARSFFRVNLAEGFLYPLTSVRRLLTACLVLPLSLVLVVPPILLGLVAFGAVPLSLRQGLGMTLAVGMTCLLVGSVPFTFLAGYMLRCRKEVMTGASGLPSWGSRTQLFHDGGKMDVLGLLFALPTMALFWGGVASVGLTINNLHQHASWTAVLLAVVGSGAGLVCLLGALLSWLLAMLVSPMATLRLALGAGPLQAVHPGSWWADVRRGWFDYLLCCCLVWGASVLFQALQAAFWPLIVISFPAQVYLQLVWANLLGQYARAYLPERISSR
jgi:hypothetical protein